MRASSFRMKLSLKDKLTLGFAFAFIVAVLLAIGGWFANIVKIVMLVSSTSEATSMLIARIVGIPFIPLGVILGYF